MRVTFNSYSRQVLPRLQSLNGQQQAAQNQLATGQRITRASDDASAVGRVLNLDAEKKREQQFFRNAGHALDLNRGSFSALEQIQKTSTRAGELAVRAVNVLESGNFAAYGFETNQLLEQALDAANTKQEGEHLFGGTSTNTPPFTAVRDAAGRITSVTYQGAAEGAAFRVSAGEPISPCTSGAENQAIATYLNHLAALRDAMESGTSANVTALRPALASDEDAVLGAIARSGAMQYRIETSASEATERFEKLEGFVSREADIDYAEAAVRFNQSQTAYQAALQSAARIEDRSLLDYLR